MNWQFYHQSNGQIDKYDSIDKFYHECGIDGFDINILSGEISTIVYFYYQL